MENVVPDRLILPRTLFPPQNMPVILIPRNDQQPPPRVFKGRRTCCVPGCASVQSKDTELSFHRIPMDTYRRRLWIYALGLEENPPVNTLVCSRHFTKESFIDPSVTFRSMTRRKLHGNAVPTIFIPPNRTPLIPVTFNTNFVRVRNQSAPSQVLKVEASSMRANPTSNEVPLSSEETAAISSISSLVEQCKTVSKQLQRLERLQTSSFNELKKIEMLLECEN